MLVFHPHRKSILHFKTLSGEGNHSWLVCKQKFLPDRPKRCLCELGRLWEGPGADFSPLCPSSTAWPGALPRDALPGWSCGCAGTPQGRDPALPCAALCSLPGLAWGKGQGQPWELLAPAQPLSPGSAAGSSEDGAGYPPGFMDFRGGRGRKVYGCIYEELEIICIC